MVSDFDAAGAAIDLAAKRLRESKRFEGNKPRRIADIMLNSLNAAADRLEKAGHPLQRKRAIAQLVTERVGDPDFHYVLANRAAEYVIYHGLPENVLLRLLDELDWADEHGRCRRGRGHWFSGVLKLRLQSHGIAELKKRADQ